MVLKDKTLHRLIIAILVIGYGITYFTWDGDMRRSYRNGSVDGWNRGMKTSVEDNHKILDLTRQLVDSLVSCRQFRDSVITKQLADSLSKCKENK